MIKFEWDENKNLINQQKHGVSFEEAVSVFYDDLAVQFYDEGHSYLEEDRFLLLGMSNKAKLLMVCHCEKQLGNNLIIISARKATKKETTYYKR
jgi:uncharacterized DUF497 family protein